MPKHERGCPLARRVERYGSLCVLGTCLMSSFYVLLATVFLIIFKGCLADRCVFAVILLSIHFLIFISCSCSPFVHSGRVSVHATSLVFMCMFFADAHCIRLTNGSSLFLGCYQSAADVYMQCLAWAIIFGGFRYCVRRRLTD